MNNNVVWGTQLDKRYNIRVDRTGTYTGTLKIFDGEKLLKEWPVTLSYQAIFGPDVQDVSDWQAKVVEFVDSLPKE